jgi:uncharacterized protein (TIGR02145 family)
MKANKRIIPIILASMFLMFATSCKKSTKPENIVEDIDGNQYHTVTIGSQVWMVENLRVTHYRNGDPILNYSDPVGWSNQTAGAYCNYNNELGNAATYGRIYNWYVVSESRNICPEGWHIPSEAEWNQMVNYLGGNVAAVNAIKQTGSAYWGNNNPGTNSSGFSALPGGVRSSSGNFSELNNKAAWWVTCEICINNGKLTYINSADNKVYNSGASKKSGCSIRLIKD